MIRKTFLLLAAVAALTFAAARPAEAGHGYHRGGHGHHHRHGGHGHHHQHGGFHASYYSAPSYYGGGHYGGYGYGSPVVVRRSYYGGHSPYYQSYGYPHHGGHHGSGVSFSIGF
jgi:hypothetical protein